jgi:hypothetical protein
MPTKREPISSHELPRIVHTIKENGSWSGTRGGRIVELEKRKDLLGSFIAWGVCLTYLWTRGRSATVAEAVDQCNALIQGRRPAVTVNAKLTVRVVRGESGILRAHVVQTDGAGQEQRGKNLLGGRSLTKYNRALEEVARTLSMKLGGKPEIEWVKDASV